GRVFEGSPGPRRLPRTLAALPDRLQATEYAPDPPPCERTRQTPQPDPTLLRRHGLALVQRIALRAAPSRRGSNSASMAAHSSSETVIVPASAGRSRSSAIRRWSDGCDRSVRVLRSR